MGHRPDPCRRRLAAAGQPHVQLAPVRGRAALLRPPPPNDRCRPAGAGGRRGPALPHEVPIL
eukprot:3961206-Prymnesium_polylepis.1